MRSRILLIAFLFVSQISLGQDAYSFFIAGHVSGQPGYINEGFHPPFKAKFEYIRNREEIEFGVLLGDITTWGEPYQWDNVDAEIDTLGLPIYFAIGNHDKMYNYDSVDYAERYGSTYYSFSHKNDLFITLDPNIDFWNISGDQLVFLQNTIIQEANSHDNIFVMMHQLLWWAPNNEYANVIVNSTEGRNNYINFWTQIEPLFNNLNNNVVMCAGDLGAASYASNLMYDQYDNITLIATGMGNRVNDNFIVINIDENKDISYDLICLDDDELNCLGNLTDWEISNIHQDYYSTNVDVYPNPVEETLSFKSSNRNIVSIDILSNTGSIVLQQKDILQIEHQLNVSHLKPGIYIVRVTTEDASQIKKFIKL